MVLEFMIPSKKLFQQSLNEAKRRNRKTFIAVNLKHGVYGALVCITYTEFCME